MTPAELDPRGCSGFGPVAALTSLDLPRSGAPNFPELARLHDLARDTARQRLRWLEDETIAVAGALPSSQELATILHHATSAQDQHLTVYRAEHGEPEPDRPDNAARGAISNQTSTAPTPPSASSSDGMALVRASRFSTPIADLCDDVALVIGAPVSAAITWGTVPADSPLLTEFNFLARLNPDDLDAPRSVGTNGLESPKDGALLVLHGHMPTLDDIWNTSLQKATHWPRLRADLPYDLDRSVEAYGLDEPGDPVTLLVEQFSQLFSEETVDDALAALRAQVRPVARPQPRTDSLPNDLTAWRATQVRGRFPGGIGRLDSSPDDGNWLVFADCAVRMDDHHLDIITALLRGTPANVSDLAEACPQGDPFCAARVVEALFPLGVIALSD